MNRLDFIKTMSVGIGGLITLPAIGFSTLPLYKEFDWLPSTASLIFRIEQTNEGIRSITSMPVCAMTYKTKIRSFGDIDYTKQTTTENINYDHLVSRIGQYNIAGQRREVSNHSQTYYTNEILLKYAKEQGFTHLYGFFRASTPIICPVTNKPFFTYFVRGVKKPDWKTINGKLQIVNV